MLTLLHRIRHHRKTELPLVALLGLDGSGKSTLLQALVTRIAPIGAGVEVIHRRPGLIAARRPADGQPHPGHYAKPTHSALRSAAKLTVIAMDWLLGYWIFVRPRRARGMWVIFDRHYLLDMQVDPLRYRYGGPGWLPRLLARVLPGPERVILLDAPVELLLARKPEVSHAEATRQRSAYLTLVRGLPGSHIVDAAQPPERVVAEVEDILTAGLPPDSAPGRRAESSANREETAPAARAFFRRSRS